MTRQTTLIKTILISAALIISSTALAQQSPIGLWKNIDDATGKPKALIRITEANGEFSGKII